MYDEVDAHSLVTSVISIGNCLVLKVHTFKKWGRSSAGRAPALQAGGQEFDSPRLHHIFGPIAQLVRAHA